MLLKLRFKMESDNNTIDIKFPESQSGVEFLAWYRDNLGQKEKFLCPPADNSTISFKIPSCTMTWSRSNERYTVNFNSEEVATNWVDPLWQPLPSRPGVVFFKDSWAQSVPNSPAHPDGADGKKTPPEREQPSNPAGWLYRIGR